MEYYPLVAPAPLAAAPTDRHPTLARNSPHATSNDRVNLMQPQSNDHNRSG